MEPVSGSNDSNPERPPVRRNVRQRQPADSERGRRGAARAPSETATPLAPPAEETGPRPCPFCGGEISAKAVVCRHCQRDLVAATGARLVVNPEQWNTSVPQWMVDQEQQFIQRRARTRKAYGWWRQILLGVTVVLVLAVLYRLFTAPLAPHLQLRARGRAGNDGPVSALAMESADQVRARQAAASASPTAAAATPAAKPSAYASSGLAADPVETAASLTAADLVGRFERDHAQADELYKDQLVRITGRVEMTETSAQAPYITLDVPSDVELRCYLAPGALGKLTRMRPGTVIHLQGRCQGWFNNVIVADCDLL